ncbi:MAG: hypothetical protein PHR34_06180 [Kiritimatiellae bacterium]|jgi:hypothetical protein|nr:hypothetical protein [Kiritimatiellia bacterium]MDD4117189.1 hypothetical protein [Kiritimatiellia bacterium]
MKKAGGRGWMAAGLLGALLVAGLAGGCDDDNYSRDPAEGMGLLVVDNFTGTRLRVYLDGERVENVSSGEHRYYDLAPGIYRIALDGSDTDRSWAGDVDLLEGRRTVMEVRSWSSDYREYDVRIYFD